MRETTITLNKKSYTLRGNFAASQEIASKVGDPMFIAREAALESIMLERSVTYEPKWRFSIENITEIIFIGAKHYDSSVKRETLQEDIFDAGFFEARDQAVEYLGLIIGPQPDIDIATAAAASGESSEK